MVHRSTHGVKIRGNSIFQNDTEIAKIERRYSSRKTHGVYKELIPNIVENNPAERAEEQKAEEYILCVDLDGTATHFNLVPLTALYEKGYFRNLLPHENVVEAINQIAREDNGIGVYVASSYLTDSDLNDPPKMVHRSTSGESGSKANKYTLTENLRKHIEDVDLSVPRKRGIGGAHNKNNFLKNDIKVVSITPNNNIKGVETIEYQMPKLDKTGTPIPGEYQVLAPGGINQF